MQLRANSKSTIVGSSESLWNVNGNQAQELTLEAFGEILKVAVADKSVSEVLTFLRSDVHYTFADEDVLCFAVLGSELEKSQKQLPAKYSQKLCSSFPQAVACGSQREFLRPGSQLMYIPGGRKARAKNAQNTVYRKALYLSKASLDTTTVSVLERASRQTKTTSYDARVWSDDEDFQIVKRCKHKHESIGLTMDFEDYSDPDQSTSCSLVVSGHGTPVKRSTPAASGHGTPVKRSTPAVLGHRSPVKRSKPAVSGHGTPVKKSTPAVLGHRRPVKKSTPAVSGHGTPVKRSTPAVLGHRSPVKRSKPAVSGHGTPVQRSTRAVSGDGSPIQGTPLDRPGTAGNVQEVLLRALRKRVQPQAEIPKRKCCRVDINRCQICRKRFEVGKGDECVGWDSCPRWYHKKCAGNPNKKKKWQCKQC